ncbi:hypothetical protein G6031_01730 [Dietzia sp. CQ4]|nr:hypothetical protein [Dietzia sp. CQ4]
MCWPWSPNPSILGCDGLLGDASDAPVIAGSPPGRGDRRESDRGRRRPPWDRAVQRIDDGAHRRGRTVLEHAIGRRETQAGLDTELTLDLLAAPLYYRAFFGHQPIDADLARRTVMSVLNGVATPEWQHEHRATHHT